MRRADPEQSAAFAQHDAARASERALRASRPSNRWLESERPSLDARSEIMPIAPKGRGRRSR